MFYLVLRIMLGRWRLYTQEFDLWRFSSLLLACQRVCRQLRSGCWLSGNVESLNGRPKHKISKNPTKKRSHKGPNRGCVLAMFHQNSLRYSWNASGCPTLREPDVPLQIAGKNSSNLPTTVTSFYWKKIRDQQYSWGNCTSHSDFRSMSRPFHLLPAQQLISSSKQKAKLWRFRNVRWVALTEYPFEKKASTANARFSLFQRMVAAKWGKT